MTQSVRHVDTQATQRLANNIGLLKIVLIGLVVVCSGVAASADTAPAVMVVLVGILSMACVYAVFGALEHMLLLLIVIAHNTAGEAPEAD